MVRSKFFIVKTVSKKSRKTTVRAVVRTTLSKKTFVTRIERGASRKSRKIASIKSVSKKRAETLAIKEQNRGQKASGFKGISGCVIRGRR